MIKYLKDGFYYYFFHSVGLRGLFILSEDIRICDAEVHFIRSIGKRIPDSYNTDWEWTKRLLLILDQENPLDSYSSMEDFLIQRNLVDFIVSFRPSESLPEKGRCYHFGDAYYGLNDSWEPFHYESWHSEYPGKPPYAYVHWKAPGQLEVLYLEDHSHMVSLSRQLFNIIGMESLFLDYKRFLLHSSLVDYKGKGILFSGASGIGKSTQAKLWESHAKAEILNGDVAGICKREDGYYAYGLPWAGSSGIYRNESVKISMIVMLSKGPDNILEPMMAPMAVMNLYAQVLMHRFDPAFVDVAMGLIEEMVNKVQVYHFSCRPDKDAVMVVKEELLRLSDSGAI